MIHGLVPCRRLMVGIFRQLYITRGPLLIVWGLKSWKRDYLEKDKQKRGLWGNEGIMIACTWYHFNTTILALNYKVKSSRSCRIVCANVLPRHRSRSRDSRGFDDFKNSCFLLFRKSAWSIKSCSHFSRQIKMFEMFQITKNSTFRNSKITFFRSKSMTKYLNFRKNSCFRKYMSNIHSDTHTRNIYYWLKFVETEILENFRLQLENFDRKRDFRLNFQKVKQNFSAFQPKM